MIREFRADMLGLYRQVAQEYGDVIRLRFLWVNTYAVNHPELIKHVLQENNRNYRRNIYINRLVTMFFGEGLFTLDGESWLSRRRLMQPAFHRHRLTALGRLMTDAAEALLAEWRNHDQRQPLAIDEEMMKLTLRVAGKALFSVDLLGASSELGDAFTEVSEYANYRMQNPLPPPLFVPTARNRRFQQALATLDQTIYAIIAQRRKAHAAGNTEDSGDLLDMLMAARDEETGEGMTDKELRNEITLLMFAGHDTTANTLTWAFYLLSQYPEAEATLHAEVTRQLAGRTPTVDDLPKLPYTKMVIEETLRLYPPAWGVGRQSIEADNVGGYKIPANASLTLPIYVIHRDPRWWDDPDHFDPARFAPDRSTDRHKFAYLPFGAGPRQCIGNNFAMMEAQLILATLAQHYRLSLIPDHRVEPDPVFVLRTSDGLPMTLAARG